jgi:hypothetical protein
VDASLAALTGAVEIYGADSTIAADIWADSDRLLIWRTTETAWADLRRVRSGAGSGEGRSHSGLHLNDRPVIPSAAHARHVLEIMDKAMVLLW